MKKKLIGAAGMYFAVMLIFAILSRAADSVNVIQIQVKNPQNQMVTHEVTGTGKVEGSQEMAVFVQENLQVQAGFGSCRGNGEKRGCPYEAFRREHFICRKGTGK